MGDALAVTLEPLAAGRKQDVDVGRQTRRGPSYPEPGGRVARLLGAVQAQPCPLSLHYETLGWRAASGRDDIAVVGGQPRLKPALVSTAQQVCQ